MTSPVTRIIALLNKLRSQTMISKSLAAMLNKLSSQMMTSKTPPEMLKSLTVMVATSNKLTVAQSQSTMPLSTTH